VRLHHRPLRRRGLGDSNTTAGIVAASTSVALPAVAPVVSSLAASSLAAGGSGYILGMLPATAIPVIGAAIAGVATLAEILIKNSGCGITCVETSQWANQAEPVLSQNILAYFSQPAPRSRDQQTAALNIFDTTWARLQQVCGQPGTGNAGKRCISDRQAGACTWKQRADSPLLNVPGEPQPGACWNWFSGYRDPIANDSQVAGGGSVSSLLSSISGGGSSLPLLLVAGLVLAAVLM